MTSPLRSLAALLCAAACAGERPQEDDRTSPGAPRQQPLSPTGDGEAVEYTLRFPAPHTHYLEVEAIVPTAGEASIELMMAVWTPGSYLVREYSRHLEEVRAATMAGEPLPLTKSAKNRWQIETGGAPAIAVRYRVYAYELSVRTNYVTDELAMLNGAPTFLTPVGGHQRRHEVRLRLPEGWTASVTGLPPHPGGAPHHYVARDYDQLVDSPIVAGTPSLHEFSIEGVPHVLANFLHGGIFDGERAARDIEAITRANIDFWGVIPYQRYVFLNVLAESRGGLEHMDSTLVLASKWATRKREDHLRWLALMNHEFFHTWNVKRLRPIELGPFDYEREVYTEGLWAAEGLTSYYADLLLARIGLLERDEYFDRLSDLIRGVEEAPGRLVQPLARASFDAWIKHYRPDENSVNTTISYYRKGAVVGFLLDAEIRRQSGGRATLDDAMRLAYDRYAGERGYTPEELLAVFSEVAGAPLDAFFDRAINGTDELDYAPAFSWYGLRFRPAPGVGGGEDPAPAFLGASVDDRRGLGVITSIRRHTPAHDAGLNVEDELLAIDEYRVTPGVLADRLARYRPGDRVTFLVSRRGTLRRIPVELGHAPSATHIVEPDPAATAAQRGRLEDWLRGRPR